MSLLDRTRRQRDAQMIQAAAHLDQRDRRERQRVATAASNRLELGEDERLKLDDLRSVNSSRRGQERQLEAGDAERARAAR